jgi:ubiquinone/menaquinone biosynthesis C-methylase UbiE
MTKIMSKFDWTSKIYDWVDYPFERFRYRPIRQRIWSGLSGKILDAGVGTGCNIPFYPKEAEVVGVDFSEGMLAKAAKKAEKFHVNVDLRQASVYDLPFPDRTFDTVVATFLCCVVDDPARAARELKRVCKKEGRLIFLEYVLSKRPLRRLIQRSITPYTRLLFGVDFTQDTLGVLRREGYTILQVEDLTADVLKLIFARSA